MSINSNPFCILNVPSTANRQEIIAATAKMSQEKGKEVCAEACSKLLDPICRFEAEMDWFLDETLEGQRYLSDCIYARLPIPEMGKSALSELNAVLYNLDISISPLETEVSSAVIKADDCIKRLNAHDILQQINRGRQLAGVKEATLLEVQTAIHVKKADVIQGVCTAIFSWDFLDFLSVVTHIADEYMIRACAANTFELYGEVVAMVLSEYERITAKNRERACKEVDDCIAEILTNAQSTDIDRYIKYLDAAKITMDIYNFPLQIKAGSFGTVREVKDNTDRRIIALAEQLNKKHGKPWEAIRLMGMTRTNPVDKLIPPGPLENTGIIPKKGPQTEGNTIQIVDKLIQLDRLSWSLKQYPRESEISQLIRSAEALNMYIKSLRKETEYARYITRELDRMLLDISGFFGAAGNKAYESRLDKVLKQVTRELGLPQKGEYIPRQSGETDSKKTGCGTWIIALLAGVAIFALLIFVSVSF